MREPGRVQNSVLAAINNTFIVESYLPTETDVRVSLTGGVARLRNVVTDATLAPQTAAQGIGRGGRGFGGFGGRGGEQRATFTVHLLPHSYAVFAAEK